ncbi:hypothetical protein HPP92_022878 [Vanilla planifolia]|uniref:Polygalacturonase n=1 Tax=Vanilla planifolia TaxID=51239 RepID=A0A835PW71_VANPL|nr:hypothetical protein HPP92_022878 [Vanilla planifolia]
MRAVSVVDHGAKGNGLNDDTEAFVQAWKLVCSSKVGATLKVPTGNAYLLRPITFGGPCKSKIVLSFHVSSETIKFKFCFHFAAMSVPQTVQVSSLKVIAPERSPNTDGIHLSSCVSVAVEDSIISTGDDCVSIVGNSSSILIKNMVCGPGHGISIGSLGQNKANDQVQDILVDEAFVSNTENGVRIKTWQTSAVKVENVAFIDIKGTSATEEAIKLACSDSYPCKKILLKNIELSSYSGGDAAAYCWKASGFSSGEVYPPPCLSDSDQPIQKITSSSLLLYSSA